MVHLVPEVLLDLEDRRESPVLQDHWDLKETGVLRGLVGIKETEESLEKKDGMALREYQENQVNLVRRGNR